MVDQCNILVVEDNPLIRELATLAVSKLSEADQQGRSPFRVVEADNGQTALVRAQAGDIQLMIVDLYMPVMDGFTLIERLRDDVKTKGISIMAVSGGGPEAKDRAYDVGADAFLAKPLRLTDMLKIMRTLLNSRPG